MAEKNVKKKINPAKEGDKNRLLVGEFAVNSRELTLEFGNNEELDNENLRKLQGFEQKEDGLSLKAADNEVVKLRGNDEGAVPGKEKRERRDGDKILSVTLIDIATIMKAIDNSKVKTSRKSEKDSERDI